MKLHISFFKPTTGKWYDGGEILVPDELHCGGNKAVRQAIYDEQKFIVHPEQFIMVAENRASGTVFPRGSKSPFFHQLFLPVALQPREEKNLQNRVRKNTK
jgi:hypothetical protein